MVLLDHIWDDVIAGPRTDRGLGRLRKDLISAKPSNIKGVGGEGSSNYKRTLSMPATPGTPVTPVTPTTPSPTAVRKDNVWRSVFYPGGNLATKSLGAELFDKPQPDSPTVNDRLYSGESRSKHF